MNFKKSVRQEYKIHKMLSGPVNLIAVRKLEIIPHNTKGVLYIMPRGVAARGIR